MLRTLLPAALLLTLLSPARVHALATESLGNAPIRGWGFDSRLLDLVNVPSRVYWFEVNGNPYFFFKGGPKELNEALRQFARLPDEKKEIILLPGPGLTKTFDGKPVPFDWSVHVPAGLRFTAKDSELADDRATFTIHIPNPLPPAPADPAKVRQWVADLASDDFKTRARAAAELEALGPAVAPVLREALGKASSAEARDRLEKVLARVSREIRLDVLALPDGIPVIGLDDLFGRYRKELSHRAYDVRGMAATRLGSHQGASPDEVIPDLEKVLKTETHEYPLRCAAGSAGRLGASGKPLLPALHEAMKTDDKSVREACRHTIDAIEKASPDPADEAAAKTRATIRREIRAFVEARAKPARR